MREESPGKEPTSVVKEKNFTWRGRKFVAVFQSPIGVGIGGPKAPKPSVKRAWDCAIRETKKNKDLVAVTACRFTPERGCFSAEPFLTSKGERAWSDEGAASLLAAAARTFSKAKPNEKAPYNKLHFADCNGACSLCRAVEANDERVQAKVSARQVQDEAEDCERKAA